MIPGFSTKKIKISLGLGQRLKAAREKKGISLVEAETGTKVRAKHLSAMENGKWEVLPQDVYVRGFVLAYCRFLELEAEEILKLFENEVKVRQNKNGGLSYHRSVREVRVLITPRLLAYSALSILSFAMVAYIVFQLAGFAGSPNLKIMNPANNAIVENDSMDLEGITDTNTVVTVNNENVPVTSDGHFAQNLKLHRGVNVLSVKAINKVKKESSEVYTVEFRPKTAAADEKDQNF